ncbi:6-phosphogluconate dehydrogenase C-terminal domain-like protein [Pleurostoma richardsiae]|uniref:6-phosphogluconate dehydrogenase C-terminal domain-like protein n=1 Tax=Pleurostoma richardsiae TaxID=41990 RepID=A0AA38VEG1_9PEZI|nr:6-phosphogluconate dehydrogenase C-terminal domain-like protein [Pleurostoma richardsiae]
MPRLGIVRICFVREIAASNMTGCRGGTSRIVRAYSHSVPVSGRATPSPFWLQAIVKDQTPAPKLYAWRPENLSEASKDECHGRDSPLTRKAASLEDRRRIYVLGLGNLGRLFATALAKLPSPPPITLVVHRRALLEDWARHPGIELTTPSGADLSAPPSAFDIEWWTEEPPPSGPVREVADGGIVRNLIVATKAPAAVPQVDRLRRYLDEGSSVLFVQNGVSRLWPPQGTVYSEARYVAGRCPSWLLGVTMHGVYSLGPFRSVFASPADVVVGPVALSEEAEHGPGNYLTEQVLAAPYLAGRAVPRAQVWMMQLEKLVINSVINPLTAVLRCRNGVLFADPSGEAARVMDMLLEETSRVLQSLVRDESTQEILRSDPTAEIGTTTTVHQQDLLDRLSIQKLRAMLHQVGDKVKDNYSSMYQDATAGKDTEIREFNGWLVETAKYLDSGLDVTCHKTLIDLVEKGVVLEPSDLGRYFPAQSITGNRVP